MSPDLANKLPHPTVGDELIWDALSEEQRQAVARLYGWYYRPTLPVAPSKVSKVPPSQGSNQGPKHAKLPGCRCPICRL